MILISACLCGIDTKYNGGNNFNPKACQLFKEGKAVLVCPEQLGGLTTPRLPAEIYFGTADDVLKGNGKVINNQAEDVTAQFVKGAEETLKIAKAIGCKKAILKSNSPSCGCGKIYNGKFEGVLVDGNGVTAQLLINNGIEVITEKEL